MAIPSQEVLSHNPLPKVSFNTSFRNDLARSKEMTLHNKEVALTDDVKLVFKRT